MILLSKILVRILPWDPWLPGCRKNLTRSCHDSQDAERAGIANELNAYLANINVIPAANFLRMSPENYEAHLFLKINKQVWDGNLVHNIISDCDVMNKVLKSDFH